MTPTNDKILKMNAVIITLPFTSAPMHTLPNGNSPGGQPVTLLGVEVVLGVEEEVSVVTAVGSALNVCVSKVV